MAEIVLATLNARYTHCAFGLRYLLANLGELRSKARLAEFEISQRPRDIVESLLAGRPRIVGLGVYIWNVAPMTEVVALLKRVRPEVCVVIGGPEVSYELEAQPIVGLADYVITGEADLEFARLARRWLGGDAPATKVIAAGPPDVGALALPYEAYADRDIAHRTIYVEASRGCPFHCEFCLSSLDVPVRQFPLDAFEASLQRLLDRGATAFKFVDRTFNLSTEMGCRLLAFFRERCRPGLFLHFEMIPDRLPPALRTLIRGFPDGTLQFEMGLQSLDPEVCARIGRRQDLEKAEANFRFLRQETGVHLHADLIVGLPGETLEGFAAGFDRLVSWLPQEIQVGILKRLRGTPIVGHDAEWGMIYSPVPPYELLANRLLDFATMQRLQRFARHWDLIANRGNFIETTPLLWQRATPFAGFLRFSDWLHSQRPQSYGIALTDLVELVFAYLTQGLGLETAEVAAVLARDYARGGRSDRPKCLRLQVHGVAEASASSPVAPGLKRQARHRQAPPNRG